MKRESLSGAERQKDGAWSPSRAERKEAAKGGWSRTLFQGVGCREKGGILARMR